LQQALKRPNGINHVTGLQRTEPNSNCKRLFTAHELNSVAEHVFGS